MLCGYTLLFTQVPQRGGGELINVGNTVYDQRRWNTLSVNPLNLALVAGDVSANEALIKLRSNGRPQLLWYWYDVADHTLASQFGAKLLQVWGAIKGKRGAAVISLSTDAQNGVAAAREVLRTAANTVVPIVHHTLRGE